MRYIEMAMLPMTSVTPNSQNHFSLCIFHHRLVPFMSP